MTSTPGGIYRDDSKLKVTSVHAEGPPAQRKKHEFEPDTDMAGGFKHERRFAVSGGRPGVIIQQVKRNFTDVRTGSPTSGNAPLDDAHINALVRKPRVPAHKSPANPHAEHHDYFEAWMVDEHGNYTESWPPKSGASAKDLPKPKDTFQMSSIRPWGRNVGKDTTSGKFTMEADARFFPHDEPHKLLRDFDFSVKRDDTTPANYLHHRAAEEKGKKLDMNHIEQVVKSTGQVEHRLDASWDTFNNEDKHRVYTKLRANDHRWVEGEGWRR